MENGIQISSINKQLSNEDQHFGKKAASKNKENTRLQAKISSWIIEDTIATSDTVNIVITDLHDKFQEHSSLNGDEI